MPESTPHSTELTSQYISQVASDLDRNVKEQERIKGELAALQAQLSTLEQDHTVLVSVREALGVPVSSPEPTDTQGAVEPSPRKRTARASAAGQQTRKATARGRQDEETPTKTAQPTLVDLIHQHVSEQKEPRSAAEIAEALRQAHTERAIDTKVVRTTLENLVARSRVHRTKQGHSVLYTAADTQEETASPQSEIQPEIAV
ncbi:BlaI/MecI/CopY family transcriptional regulator [Streptomyces arenae]|uniref:BlaI/MecI/CopY family transcriptional regulator n=1 Tax=Streptomyces arenae TaxID=29301 RepID=UPI0026580544|nr:BlaI/MecI/CopY family transcriptional regulator [Streptomyces arenae]MCG7209643.1 BlaI/MecI/CopY family transcriptional regulator [Streptomyces arenae]